MGVDPVLTGKFMNKHVYYVRRDDCQRLRIMRLRDFKSPASHNRSRGINVHTFFNVLTVPRGNGRNECYVRYVRREIYPGQLSTFAARVSYF